MSKKTLAAIKKSKNDAIIQVKDNQPSLSKKLTKVINSQKPTEIDTTIEKNRNRIETRIVESFILPIYSYFDFKKNYAWDGWNQYITSVIKVTRITETYDYKTNKYATTIDTSLYIATYADNVKAYANQIRNHWAIENSNHYVRDQSLLEDDSRIRKNPQSFATLRSFALNILRFNKENNIRTALYKNCCDLDRLLKYIWLF